MVDYKLLLVWGFPFLLFLFELLMVDYRFLPSVGLSIFIAFVCVAYAWSITGSCQCGVSVFIVFVHVKYGRLQTLASVGLSVFDRFCSRCTWSIVDSR